MGGVCGIFVRDRSQHVPSEGLSLMVSALDFCSPGPASTTSFGRVAMAAQPSSGRVTGVAEEIIRSHSLAIAFHGSLYNLGEICGFKEETSDVCRALLNLYKKEGRFFVRHLLGDFSLALWDGEEESLYLAVDRFRVCPLFYYEDGEKFVFASCIKAIMDCSMPVKLMIDPTAIVDLVAMSIIPTPKTIFREIRKIPAAHCLTYRRGKTSVERYWRVSFLQPSEEGEKALANQFRTLLKDAVNSPLKVDRDQSEIGSFLSGGVDSSSVTGILTQIIGHPVRSFSIGFDEERYNETSYAQIAAKAFGAKHYEYFVSAKDTYDAIPLMQQAFDEPYGNASTIPAYFCANKARENGVGILYAGDGGDELFAGNQRYADQKIFEYYQQVPTWLREKVLEPIVFGLAKNLPWRVFERAKKYIQRSNIPYHERITSYDFFRVVSIADFLEPDFLEEVGRNYDPYWPFSFYYFEAPAKTNLDKHLYIDWHLTIADNDILKFRMAEATGICVRFPFLDYRVAEFSVRVPSGIKMPGSKLRAFQKAAFADLLPLEVRTKKKHGFGLPIPGWLRTDRNLNEMMRELVLSHQSLQRGYFRKEALEGLVESHRTDKTGFYGTILWYLMVLELWHRRYWNGCR